MLCQPFGHKGQRGKPRRPAAHGHAQVNRFPICSRRAEPGAAASRAAPLPSSGAQSGHSHSPGG